MKVKLIVHSVTGNTKAFADEIKKEVLAKGHTVDETVIQTNKLIDGRSGKKDAYFEITNIPDCSDYDYILIGGPVWAFSATPVVMKCIEGAKGIKGKKIIPFVTHLFPFAFMGGISAVSMMSKSAKKAGGDVMAGYILNISWHNYKDDMKKYAQIISDIIK